MDEVRLQEAWQGYQLNLFGTLSNSFPFLLNEHFLHQGAGNPVDDLAMVLIDFFKGLVNSFLICLPISIILYQHFACLSYLLSCNL